MKKLKEKIMKTDFAKKIKQLVIAALCVGVIGGGLSAYMLRTQIGEIYDYAQNRRQTAVEHYGEGIPDDAEADGQAEDWRRNIEDGDWREERHRKADREEWMEEWHGKQWDFERPQITEPSMAAKVTIGIVWVLGSMIAVIYWLLVAAWLYQAAVNAGMNGLLWLVAGLAGNLYAAVVFLLVRSFIRTKCPSCGAFHPTKTQYCSKCGAAINEKCADCGQTCTNGDQFCRSCGKPLHGNKA